MNATCANRMAETRIEAIVADAPTVETCMRMNTNISSRSEDEAEVLIGKVVIKTIKR